MRKNMSEKEFLENYDILKYDRLSMTADIVACQTDNVFSSVMLKVKNKLLFFYIILHTHIRQFFAKISIYFQLDKKSIKKRHSVLKEDTILVQTLVPNTYHNRFNNSIRTLQISSMVESSTRSLVE